MVFRLVRHGPNVAISRSGKELRGQAKRSPLLIEARHEKRLTELAHFHDVPDVGTIGRAIPLGVVIPHRVRRVADDLADGIETQRETLREENEIRLEPVGTTQDPLLRELATDQALGAAVIEQAGLVTSSLERPLHASFHPPFVVAADDQDLQDLPGFQCSARKDLSHNRAYFAMTLAAARHARISP